MTESRLITSTRALMELELIEPFLFFSSDFDSVVRFANALISINEAAFSPTGSCGVVLNLWGDTEMNTNSSGSKPRSLVLEFQPDDPAAAQAHFQSKLAFGTDPSDVYADLQNGVTDFVVVDARSPQHYEREHVPGAINFPHRQINDSSVSVLPKDKLIVVYCDGTGCNGSTKAAVKLTRLGFHVKEMIGGIDWWKRDGYAVHTAEDMELPQSTEREHAKIACGC